MIPRKLAVSVQQGRGWFVLGSGLVQARFMIGSVLVHEWLFAGSLVVRWCFPHVFNVVLILLL